MQNQEDQHKVQLTLETSSSCITYEVIMFLTYALLVGALMAGCRVPENWFILRPHDQIIKEILGLALDGYLVGPKGWVDFVGSRGTPFSFLLVLRLSVTCPALVLFFCWEEVTKVFLIAAHERRIKGCRFASLKHIFMFGLSLSGVGEAVRKILNDRELNNFADRKALRKCLVACRIQMPPVTMFPCFIPSKCSAQEDLGFRVPVLFRINLNKLDTSQYCCWTLITMTEPGGHDRSDLKYVTPLLCQYLLILSRNYMVRSRL